MRHYPQLYLVRQLIALSLLGSVCPLARADIGLALSPLRDEIQIIEGESYSGSLTLSNTSSGKTHVRAATLDFLIDGDQEPQFRSAIPDESAQSCRQWLRVNPSEFDLDAASSVLVRYTFHFPIAVPEGVYHCALGFTTVGGVVPGSTGVTTNVRLVTAFYATSGRPTVVAEVRRISFEAVGDADQRWRAVVTLANIGNGYFRPIGSLEILDTDGKSVESVAFRPTPVLPGHTQRFLFPLKTAPSEEQTVRARFDIGTGEILEARSPVHVPFAAKP